MGQDRDAGQLEQHPVIPASVVLAPCHLSRVELEVRPADWCWPTSARVVLSYRSTFSARAGEATTTGRTAASTGTDGPDLSHGRPPAIPLRCRPKPCSSAGSRSIRAC